LTTTQTDLAPHAELHGVRVPRLSYGTAWKEDATAGLTRTAIAAGFRGIDTANQRRHYDEAAVGEGMRAALAAGGLSRGDLFVQTKFTQLAGQDHRLPYDPDAPLARQVAQSLASSLAHLGVEQVDSFVLHGPSSGHGLTDADWEIWGAMERAHGEGKTRLLGVSNVNLGQLKAIHATATVRPAIVQNRCFAARGWDRAVRAFCNEAGMLYQGFSLLTANPEVMRHRRIAALASSSGKTVPQIIFRFALQVGMIALTGTTSSRHMAEDLDIYDFALEADEINAIETLVG
jgi:diketogulonate reductase-like aldo/keto reductase